MAISYPKETWKAIKELWEVSPKTTSMREILEQVAECLDCSTPNAQTVADRIKREKWKKLTASQIKKRAINNTGNSTENSTENSTRKQQIYSSKKTKKNIDKSISYGETNSIEENTKNTDDVATKNHAIEVLKKGELTKAKTLIEKFRNQSLSLFNLVNNVSSITDDALTELECNDFFDPESTNALANRMQALKIAGDVVKSLTDASERSVKNLARMYGIDADDFVDKQELQVRNAAAHKHFDEKLKEQKALMATQQRQAFERDLSGLEDKMRN